MTVLSSRIYRSNYNLWVLGSAAVITWILVAIPTLYLLAQEAPQFLAQSIFLVLLFGALSVHYWFLESKWAVHISILLQTLTVTTLILIYPNINNRFSVYFFVICSQLLIFLPLWEGAAWAVIISLLTIFGERSVSDSWASILDNIAVIGAYVFFATFGAMLRLATETRLRSDALALELQEANHQLADYAAEVEKLAAVDERNRLARELHDALGHRLTVAVVQLEGARRLIPTEPDRASNMVETMRSELKQGLAELRETVASLRTQPEEHLTLTSALDALISNFRDATGLTVNVTYAPALPNISVAIHHALFRACQESLTNVQRHAEASEVWVKLDYVAAEIVLSMADNGQGFPDKISDDRFGIQGIRERIELLGGRVDLGRSDSGGAKIDICVPTLNPETTYG